MIKLSGQKVKTKQGIIPVEKLCGWGVWKSDLEFDYNATRDLVREQFNIFGSTGSKLYKKLNIVGAAPITGSERMMLWEVCRKLLGKDTPNYPQEIGDPFVSGTKVLMLDGSEKNIEDIKIGEYVVNHKNEPAKVTNIIKKKFTGNLVTIKIKGWHRKLTATETHTGLFLPSENYRFKYNGVERRKFGEYQIGDYVHLSFGLDTNDSFVLDIKDYVTDCDYDDKFVWKNNGKKINRFVAVDSNFARFIGLYLAKGGADIKYGHVRFSFNSNETIFHEEIKEYAKSIFGLDSTFLDPKKSCRVVSINSVILASFIKSIIPEDLYNKSIPNFFFRCGKATKLSLLRGWLDEDGYIGKKVNRLIEVSSSHQLISDISRLAISCHINPKTLIRKKSDNQRVSAATIDIYCKDCNIIYQEWTEKKKTRNLSLPNTPYGFARKIQNIEYQYVEDEDVYCITTENEFTAIFNGVAQFQCVSFGGKNAIEYVQFFPMANGASANFKQVFPPYLYGTGRVLIGNGQLGNQDGSLGNWQAEAVMKYGTVPIDTPGCPAYSGSVAKKWGVRPGPPKEFIEIGRKFLVKSAAPVKTWEELVQAIMNGYPVTFASNVGFDMTPRSDGFHHNSTQWGHQMCCIGIDNDYSTPYACILNSWGDVHGNVKDFTTGETWPAGTLRALRKDVEKILRENESFAYSQFDGFPSQELPRNFFNIF